MGIDFRRLSLSDALAQDPQFLTNLQRITGQQPMVTDLLGPGHMYVPSSVPPIRERNGGSNQSVGIRPVNFDTSSGVWEVSLSHEDVLALRRDADSFLDNYLPFIAEIIKTCLSLISIVDAIGFNNGVNITGIFQTPFVTVTPRFVSAMDVLKSIAPALRNATGLPGGVIGAGMGAGIGLLAAGPAGIVLGGVAGWLGDAVFSNDPRPGDVHCDRRSVGPWEKFMLASAGEDKVGIWSWRGYFCAENGGGGPVHANRGNVGPWETVTMINNPNGTVSLRSENGHYLVAENGGGDGTFCNWNRTAIGDWEQFWMDYQPNGFFTLRTLSQNRYVSVQ
jgi:hypothetical protein